MEESHGVCGDHRIGFGEVGFSGTCVDAAGAVVVQRRLTRGRLLAFFAKLPSCLVGIEACAAAHHWGRELQKLGIGCL